MIGRNSFERQIICHGEIYREEDQRTQDVVVKSANAQSDFRGNNESREYTNFRPNVRLHFQFSVLLVFVLWTSICAHASLLREGRQDVVQVL